MRAIGLSVMVLGLVALAGCFHVTPEPYSVTIQYSVLDGQVKDGNLVAPATVAFSAQTNVEIKRHEWLLDGEAVDASLSGFERTFHSAGRHEVVLNTSNGETAASDALAFTVVEPVQTAPEQIAEPETVSDSDESDLASAVQSHVAQVEVGEQTTVTVEITVRQPIRATILKTGAGNLSVTEGDRAVEIFMDADETWTHEVTVQADTLGEHTIRTAVILRTGDAKSVLTLTTPIEVVK